MLLSNMSHGPNTRTVGWTGETLLDASAGVSDTRWIEFEIIAIGGADMALNDRVEMNPKIMLGKPVIRGIVSRLS